MYGYEPLAYYYGMKPQEFWDCSYREVIVYCEANCARTMENFKTNVIIQEATTDKLIRADGMNMGKKAKVIPLKKMFKELFV